MGSVLLGRRGSPGESEGEGAAKVVLELLMAQPCLLTEGLGCFAVSMSCISLVISVSRFEIYIV